MDPIACIVSYLNRETSRRDTVDALASWYRMRGGRPTLAEIEARADSRGITLPAGWGARAKRIGAMV